MKSEFIFGCCVLFLFLSVSVCDAAFVVYFKDGTSREVTKIEFKGQHVELYLATGKVLRLRKDSIDFKSTGIEPPTEENKVTIKGTRSSDKVVEEPRIQSIGPSQAELIAQWNGSKETALAIRDAGSISKGDIVRVVAITSLGRTVIVKLPDGTYKRIVINAEVFAENFEMKTASTKAAPPADSSDSSTEPAQPAEPAADSKLRMKREAQPSRAPSGSKPSLAWPLLISMGLLGLGIVSTIVLSKAGQTGNKRVRR